MENEMYEQAYEPQVNPDGFFNDLTSQNACSVRVAVRVRPLVGRELYDANQRTCVDVDQYSNKIQIGDKNFQFDRVFPLNSRQEDIFETCAKNLVLGCFAGYNATILAYGQTGSGKTHTMGTGSTTGLSEDQVGMLPRVFSFIFEELEARKKLSQFSEFTIKVSFLELYNEELHDLLDPSSIGAVDRVTGKALKELQIKEKNGNIYVQGLKEEPVMSRDECLQLLNKGISHRTTSATLMNEGSSRSHAIFTVAIEQRIVKEIQIVAEGGEPIDAQAQAPAASQQEELISAKFHFVDLAGSERIKRTGATGQLMKEGISINKGLLCLGNVISALTEESKKNNHIPYRDSKLTRILQDSLGGNSRTTMIACVSPAETNYEETLNSIKYASRARNIKNKPVVNRDPNSMLIDSLRQQINSLQGEIKEYQNILKSNNIPIPENFTKNVQDRIDQQNSTPNKPPKMIAQGNSASQNDGSINFQELRDVKIKLSRKEKELKELQEQLVMVMQKVSTKDNEISELQKERDSLRIKNEILNECLQKNNVQVDSSLMEDSRSNGVKLSLIDEYKQKLAAFEKEMEKRNKELQDKNKKIAELQLQNQRDEEVLRKHLEENQRLKRQVKKLEDQQIQIPGSPTPPSTKNITSKLKLNLQAITNNNAPQPYQPSNHKKNQSDMDTLLKKKSLDNIQIPDLNERFINNLTNQLESLFVSNDNSDNLLLNSARSIKSQKGDDDNLLDDIVNNALQDSNNLLEEDGAVQQPNVEEKEKILESIKNSAKQMQSELVELMKHEYEKRIQDLEKDLQKVDNERQDKLKKVSQNDNKQMQAIDQQYKLKMEEMKKELALFKEKEKKQEQVQKQIQTSTQKIKALEDDIQKMRKKEQDIEQLRKNDTEKFNKIKQTLSKELNLAKKEAIDKEKAVQKLKLDLKKVDQLAQKKISELHGFQKKVHEEKLKREQEKQQEYESKGIDIDRIKTWINENTRRMLEHRELKEALDENLTKKEVVEEDMLEEGQKLTELMIRKERIEIELQQLQLEDEPDEGRIMELEEDQYQLHMQIEQTTEVLDNLDETLTFLNNKINRLTEEVVALDIDNIEPIKFSGLQSVDAARVTLQTFFGVLLDLNIYQKELELKCIESDEAILGLNDKVASLQGKVQELIQLNEMKPEVVHISDNNRINTIQKDKAIKNLVDTLEGFVDYSEVKNLNLTPNEQNSLTKLSLSKILSHKLEQALNDKEQYKLKFENLKKKNKNELFVQQPLQFKDQQQQEKEMRESKFSSLAAARERRKQVGGQPSESQTPQQNQDSVLEITTITKSSGGGQATTQSNLQMKFRQKQMVKPSASAIIDESSNSLKPTHPSRQQLSSQQSLKGPMIKKTQEGNLSQNKNNSQERESDKVSNRQTLTNRPKISPKKIDSKTSADQQQDKGQINSNALTKSQMLQPITEVQRKNGHSRNQLSQSQTQPAAVAKVPNFKDRRNQRKMEHVEDYTVVEPDKVQEIDRIKEETLLITQGQAHKERKQSRARAYSKRGFSNLHAFSHLNQSVDNMDFGNNDLIMKLDELTNMKGNQDDNFQQRSPRVSISKKKPPQSLNSQPIIDIGNLEKSKNEVEVYQSEISDTIENIQSGDRDKWSYEELAMIENFGQKLIGCDCANGRIFLIFENFTIREISIDTFEEINKVDLFVANGQRNTGEQAVDFAIDKELNAIAVTSANTVYIFDFTDEYKSLATIEVGNIAQVEFCQYMIVILVKTEDSSYIVSYEIDQEPIERGSYELKTNGYQEMITSDNQFIYFACGIQLAKLQMPDLNPLFIVETEHSDVIQNFNISPQMIVTGSKDQTVRVHDIETGEQIMEPVTEIDCDYLCTEGQYVLTKSKLEQRVIVWKQEQMSIELSLIDFVQMDIPEYEILDINMRGKILARFTNGVQYDLVLIITTTPEAYLVSALKHKPLSEL